MDRNSAPGLLQETTEESRRETLRWLEACQDFPHIKANSHPPVYPLLHGRADDLSGEARSGAGLPAQSHLSENRAEMDWVRRLHPDCAQYWEAYAKYGLWNERTLMAHCVWSDQRERAAMRDSGVTMVHCPDSNLNLCSGSPQVQVMLREGVKVALGSDVAGGDRLSMFDAVAGAVRSSKARRMVDGVRLSRRCRRPWYLGDSRRRRLLWRGPGLRSRKRPPRYLILNLFHFILFLSPYSRAAHFILSHSFRQAKSRMEA